MKVIISLHNHGSGCDNIEAITNSMFIINLQNLCCIKQKPKKIKFLLALLAYCFQNYYAGKSGG